MLDSESGSEDGILLYCQWHKHSGSHQFNCIFHCSYITAAFSFFVPGSSAWMNSYQIKGFRGSAPPPPPPPPPPPLPLHRSSPPPPHAHSPPSSSIYPSFPPSSSTALHARVVTRLTRPWPHTLMACCSSMSEDVPPPPHTHTHTHTHTQTGPWSPPGLWEPLVHVSITPQQFCRPWLVDLHAVRMTLMKDANMIRVEVTNPLHTRHTVLICMQPTIMPTNYVKQKKTSHWRFAACVPHTFGSDFIAIQLPPRVWGYFYLHSVNNATHKKKKLLHSAFHFPKQTWQ